MTEKVPQEVMEEILWYQENSDRLATAAPGSADASQTSVETTTISFRLPKEEVERIHRIAEERGWSVSVLIRTWIQQGRSIEVPSDVREALTEFESSYTKLRHAIRSIQSRSPTSAAPPDSAEQRQ